MWKAYLTILFYAIISSAIVYFIFLPLPRPLPHVPGDHSGYYIFFLVMLVIKFIVDIIGWRLRCLFISKISGFYKLKGDMKKLAKYIGIFHFPLIIASLSLFLTFFDVFGISLFFAISMTMVVLMYLLFLNTIRSVYKVNLKKGLLILIFSELILLGIGLTIIGILYLPLSSIIKTYGVLQ